MKFVRKFFSKISLFFISRNFSDFKLGISSEIYPWRIKCHQKNRLTVGDGCTVSGSIVFERESSVLSIGDGCFIGKGLMSIAEEIYIGNNVMISWGVTITDHNSHSLNFSERKYDVENWHNNKKDWSTVKIKKIEIQDKVWIGFNAIILKGIVIGEGAIVAAGSVVTKNVAPFTIVAGNPAKVIRELSPDER